MDSIKIGKQTPLNGSDDLSIKLILCFWWNNACPLNLLNIFSKCNFNNLSIRRFDKQTHEIHLKSSNKWSAYNVRCTVDVYQSNINICWLLLVFFFCSFAKSFCRYEYKYMLSWLRLNWIIYDIRFCRADLCHSMRLELTGAYIKYH